MTQEEADNKFIEIGEEHAKKFEEAFAAIQSEILKYDPTYILAVNSYYSTFDSNVTAKRRADRKRILQYHIELLQSLTIRNKLEAYDFRFAPPPAIHQLRELLHDCSNSFSMRRYSTLETSMDAGERQRLRLLEDIRTHTQSLRNWGYPQQVFRIVTELFKPLDDDLEKECGIRIQNLILMTYRISEVIEERINAHVGDLHPALTASSIRGAVDNYLKLLPNRESSAEELIQVLKDRKATLKQTRLFLISHSDLRLPGIYTFTFQDFVEAYGTGVDPVALKRIIETWAYSFGDLASQNPEHFFMGNPVWTRPLIRSGDDTYLIPAAGLFLSFCLELMENVIHSFPKLHSSYLKRRAKFLEEEIQALFLKAFPSVMVYRGSLWHDPATGKDFENDLLVLLDSYQIVVEAKSGKVSDATRRGAVLSLEADVKELMIDPSIQAKRFANYLESNRGKHSLLTHSGHVNEFNNSNCHQTITLNVTLDILANLQARWTDLRKAGVIPDNLDLGPTMSLSDLELVFDLLETRCEKIHYLARRAEFERNARYLADESDLIAFYLDNGFSIGESEFDGTGLFIYGMSETLDPYYMQIWTGQKVAKPARRYTKLWRRIVNRAEQEPVGRWTEIGYLLLNLGSEEQQFFEKEFLRVRRLVTKKSWVVGDPNAYVLVTGAERHRNAVVGVAYKAISKEQRNNMLAEAAAPAFEHESVTRALVIGVNVEAVGDQHPYDVLAVFGKPS
jgi:hypothetical protein